MTKTKARTAGIEKAMTVGMMVDAFVPEPRVFW